MLDECIPCFFPVALKGGFCWYFDDVLWRFCFSFTIIIFEIFFLFFFYSLQYSSYSTVATVHALSIFFPFFSCKKD